MTKIKQTPSSYLDLLGSLAPSSYRRRSAAVVFLAVSPPLICALFVEGSDRWDLFQRSGSLTAAIGLFLASREYLKLGNFELVIRNRNNETKSNMVEMLDDIRTHKLGLAISAFGTVISGWGSYLGLWTFSYLGVWAAIAAYDTWRDFVRMRDAPTAIHSRASQTKER